MNDSPLQDVPEDIAALSFEEALSELDRVVSALESGQAPLDESISLYTRGTQLKTHCAAKLKAAQAKIEKLTFDADGQPTGTMPLDASA